MDSDLILTLLHRTESDTLDFKSQQYRFAGATDVEKAELLKDILAFANAWKTDDAFIVIGANEQQGGRAQVLGVTDHLSDADIQQFVNSKTNTPVAFLVGTYEFEGRKLDIIRIERDQRRPIFLQKPFARPHKGGLDASAVYLRRGSSTAIADPTEIAAMGAADQPRLETPPQIEIELTPAAHRLRLGMAVVCTSVRLRGDEGVFAEEERDPALLSFVSPSLYDRMRPSRAQVFNDRRMASLLTGLGLWLRNGGAVTAEDVRVQLRLPAVEGFAVVDESDVPSTDDHPRTPNFKTIHSKVSVNQEPPDWVVDVCVGKLQPQQEIWVEEPFFVGAIEATEVEGVVRVFDDRLPTPLEHTMTLSISVVERDYDEADFEDELPSWKPCAERIPGPGRHAKEP